MTVIDHVSEEAMIALGAPACTRCGAVLPGDDREERQDMVVVRLCDGCVPTAEEVKALVQRMRRQLVY